MVVLLAVCALSIQSHPKSLTGHVGGRIGDHVYVSGGIDETANHRLIGTLWHIDIKSRRWSPGPAMKVPRAMAAAAVVGGSLFVAGGFDESGRYLASVERYDVLTRRWVTVAPMLERRTRFALINHHGRLFAIGGLTGTSDRDDPRNSASVEAYDPAKNRWRSAGALQLGRHGFAAAVLGERIVVTGGYVGGEMKMSSSCEAYDVVREASFPMASLPTPRGFHATVSLRGRLIVLGGRGPTSHAAEFDAIGKRWIELPGPDLPLNRFVAVPVDLSILVVGGESDKLGPILQDWPRHQAGPPMGER